MDIFRTLVHKKIFKSRDIS